MARTRIYQDFLGGRLDAAVDDDDGILSSPAFASMKVVGSNACLLLALDPDGIDGAPEIVQVTLHTTADTTCEVQRAQAGTVNRHHDAGTEWVATVLASDFEGLAPVSTLLARSGFVSGDYYASLLGVRSDVELANDVEFASPFLVGTEHGFDQIAVNVAVAGDTGSEIRLGIKTVGEDGLPEDLVIDAGVQDGTTLGINPVAITQELLPGGYWLVAAGQGSPVTPPQVTGGAALLAQVSHSDPDLAVAGTYASPTRQFISGAFTAGGAWPLRSAVAPVILLRAT